MTIKQFCSHEWGQTVICSSTEGFKVTPQFQVVTNNIAANLFFRVLANEHFDFKYLPLT